jgi:hypothetical protein
MPTQYEILRAGDGWVYRIGEVVSFPFASRSLALEAAEASLTLRRPRGSGLGRDESDAPPVPVLTGRS